jgi:hypothetical protein
MTTLRTLEPRSLLALAALALVVSCGGPRPELQSPKAGAVLRADWTPVVVQVPLEWRDAQVRMILDGEPFEDPLLVIRRRKGSSKEPGAQLLATLPLTGLEAGEHRLEVEFIREGARDRTIRGDFVTKPRKHRVQLSLHDGQGQPVNGRVVIHNQEGPVRLTDGSSWRSERKGRNAELNAVFVRDGEGSVGLAPGTYRLVATRGLRAAVAVVDLEVDGDRTLELALPERVPLADGLTTDLHVHTGLSYDVYAPHAVRLDSLACSGLDVVAVTDHNRLATVEALEQALAGEAPVPVLLPGIEGDMRSQEEKNWDWGHLTAWPVDAGAQPPTRWPRSPAHAVANWRRHQVEHPHPVTGEEVLLTLAHPRGIQFRAGTPSKDQAWALFNNLGYQREVPVGVGPNAWMIASAGDGSTALDFDALEVVNRMGLDKYRELRLDWFALLNQGHLLTGVGASDSHALAVELVGLPQTVVFGARDDFGEPDPAAMVRALRQGNAMVTTGPYVELELLAGERRAGLGGLLQPVGQPVRARLAVRAAPWVPVHELRLVQDGAVIHRIELGGATRDEGEALVVEEIVELELAADAWLLAEAGWPEDATDSLVGGTYSIVAPGYVPFAFTNPIRVDVDGDGRWTPPGL